MTVITVMSQSLSVEEIHDIIASRNIPNAVQVLSKKVSKLEQKLSQNDKEKGNLIAKLDDDTGNDHDNSLCNINTISQRNDHNIIESSVDIAFQISNQQKTILNTPLLAEDLDDSDEIELTKN
ncbi:12544_t:CDS:2 [Dentiscutata heterogama]|uniref:12544_t:CDS:1 n=1 Tax=Dentiscutata heterogama TaxID=1316150 RepID=A0ACA9MYL1_9GLOM|nr:12544_t:CDS:2 [Dentiscutata heterogama]